MYRTGRSEHRAFVKQIAARPSPLTPAAFNPALQFVSLNVIDFPAAHDFEERCKRWNRKPAARVLRHMGNVQMRGVETTIGLDIETVSLPFPVRDRHRAPV